MSLSPSERAERRDAQRRALRRRRVLAVALVVLVGAGVGVGAYALAGGSSSPGPATAAAGTTSTTARTAGGRDRTTTTTRTVPSLPPIVAAQPGTAEAIFHGPTKGRKVALTFDDGFCPPCVARLVRVLERTGAHATFFPNGRYADSWEPVAARIRALVARGQLTVGNHTFNHGDAKAEGSAAFGADLAQNERWIKRTFHITGRPFFRPPYGSYDDGTLQEAGAQGYPRVILWSGTLADSSPQTKPYLLNAVRYWAKPGAIILAHGNYPNTAAILPRILAILKARHLEPVTIAELVGDPTRKR